jgi:hypothetical protein
MSFHNKLECLSMTSFYRLVYCLWARAGANPIERIRFFNRVTSSHTDIRLGWKGLQVTNTLTYYEHSSITAEKSVITLEPTFNTIKLFWPRLRVYGCNLRYKCYLVVNYAKKFYRISTRRQYQNTFSDYN